MVNSSRLAFIELVPMNSWIAFSVKGTSDAALDFRHYFLFSHCFQYWQQQIIMISEGSCDTEDWSNDAENSALDHRNKKQVKI